MTGKWFFPTLATAVCILGPLLPASAQDAQTEGPLLTFDVSQRLSYQSNPDLTPDGRDGAAVAVTDLSFAFRDQTATETFQFTADTDLRLEEGDGPTFDAPQLAVSYGRESASSALKFEANWSRFDTDRVATLADFTSDGFIILPVGFDLFDPILDGTRTNSGIGFRYEGQRTSPLEYSLSAELRTVTYNGDIAAVQDDSQTVILGTGLSFKLDDATQAKLDLTYTFFDEDSTVQTDRLGVRVSWQRDRPAGPLTFAVDAQETNADTRLGLTATRRLEGPRMNITFGAGVSRPDSGDIDLTGQINVSYALPQGALTFAAERNFTSATDGDDQQITSLSTGVVHQISDLSQISTQFSHLDVDSTDGDRQTAQFSMSYSYQFTSDWTLSTGVEFTQARTSDQDSADNQSVFVSLGRGFTFRP